MAPPVGQAAPIASAWKMPSRRRCAWLLSQDPQDLNADEYTFLVQLFELAPKLAEASELARRFAAILRSDEDSELDLWITQAETSELAALAKGIRRDIDAVRAAITQPWTTSRVEGQINRVKAIKRQMYGRAHYPLLRQRVLIAA
jgi:transposase